MVKYHIPLKEVLKNEKKNLRGPTTIIKHKHTPTLEHYSIKKHSEFKINYILFSII